MLELRHALRRAARRPGRVLAAALTLGVGIAGATASFAAVESVLLRPLPVEDQDRIHVFWNRNSVRGFPHVPFSPAAYETVAQRASTLVAVSAVETAGARPALLETSVGVHEVSRVRIAGDLFGALGVRPALGRLLAARDDQTGAEPALVLSHGAWLRLHGGDPGVVGTSVRIGGQLVTVAGVAPEGFDFPQGTEVWMTLRGAYPDWESGPPVGVELDLVGRVAPGVSPEASRAELAALLSQDPELAPAFADLDPVSVTLSDFLFGTQRPVLGALLASALLLLVAAVANTVLLLLAGGARITREIAVRRALGATGGRVFRHALWDAAVVSTLGGLGGLGLAWLAVDVVASLAPAELVRLGDVSVAPEAMAFAVGMASLSALAVGVVAGLTLVRPGLRSGLGSGRSDVYRGGHLRRSVASLQVALTVVTAVGAGLVLRTLVHVRTLDLGFNAELLTVVSFTQPHALFAVPPSYVQALEGVSRRLEGLPGIESVTPTLNPPLALNGGIEVVLGLEGQTEDEFRASPYVSFDAVLPGYFAALGVPVLRGRALQPADGQGGAPVVVVSEATARLLWPGEDALGKQVQVRFPGYEGIWWSVVGIVGDTRYRSFLEPRPAAYFPLARMAAIPPSRLLVRASQGGPASVSASVEQALTSVIPGARVLREEPLTEVLARPAARPRFAAAVLGCLALTTLVLAAFGVYGVFSTLVQERTREMGLRRALGAPSKAVERVVLASVLRVAGVGALAGVLISAWASRLLQSILHGVGGTDPTTFVAVTLGALTMAMLAGTGPARRAGEADPGALLRSE